MKTLQSNYTTPEQSKRLLELGVPADSADCYLLRTHTQGDTFLPKILHGETYSELDKFTNMLEYLPCWSVGQLMRIRGICAIFPPHGSSFFAHNDRYYIKSLMHIIEKHPEWFDFSKLEEQQ